MDGFTFGVKQFGNQASPTRLMRRTDTPSSVAVEILVEQHVVSKKRICLHARPVVECGTDSVFLSEKESIEATREIIGHLVDCHVHP